MPKYEFSVNRILPFKDKTEDSVLIRKNMCQRKPVFLHILRSSHAFMITESKEIFSKLDFTVSFLSESRTKVIFVVMLKKGKI